VETFGRSPDALASGEEIAAPPQEPHLRSRPSVLGSNEKSWTHLVPQATLCTAPMFLFVKVQIYADDDDSVWLFAGSLQKSYSIHSDWFSGFSFSQHSVFI